MMNVISFRSTRVFSLLGLLIAVTLALVARPARADSVLAWGDNNDGQLGDGTTINRSTPVAVSGLTSGVAANAVAGGESHSLAIQNGAALAWGFNLYGQLGNGTSGSFTNRSTPVAVTGLSSGVTAIAAGLGHSLAIQNGAALAWGDGADGELGNGAYVSSNTPVAVTGLSSGVTAIAGGGAHTLAIQNGAALAWGFNLYGQLGNGTSGIGTSSNTPVAVTGLSSGVTAVAAGGSHSLAIQNGGVYAWGYNGDGELGDGTNTNRNTPVAVTGMSTGVTAIAGGVDHSLAIQSGNVVAWGANGVGQLGNGTTTDSNTPVLALDLPEFVTEVAASSGSSYALSSDGSLWVWGENVFGQLGLVDTTNRLTPTQLHAPIGYVFTSIDADAYGDHVLATIAAVPEPTSLGLLAGLALIAALGARRRRDRIGA